MHVPIDTRLIDLFGIALPIIQAPMAGATTPTASDALGPLRRAAEAAGRDDFSPLWAGQSFTLARPMSAAALTLSLAGSGAGREDRGQKIPDTIVQ
ncbi:MAG: hypothetical protein ABI868_09050 [Acidobacteriota bacterium]